MNDTSIMNIIPCKKLIFLVPCELLSIKSIKKKKKDEYFFTL